MNVTRTDLSEMVAAAKVFCAYVEHPDEPASQWLQELTQLLPRLHAAVTSLQVPEEEHPLTASVDPEARFALFSRLYRSLGELDGYRLEYDDSRHNAPVTGSLADDLTDIYFDLREGLDWVARSHPDHAASVWFNSYRMHWGQHLVDANRHLYAINSKFQR